MNTDNPTDVPEDVYDVVCVGGGGSGLAAAATAAEIGASVLVLEKRGQLGGNANMATGLFAADSPVQQRLNLVARAEVFTAHATQYSHWRINVPLVRNFIDTSGDTIAWLETLGVTFPWVTPLFETPLAPTWHVAEGGGAAIVQHLTAHAEKHSATIRLGASVESLERGPVDAHWTVAWREQNAVHRVGARSVVIGTGGFGGNEVMMAENIAGYDPETWFCMGHPHQGDGINLLRSAGAASEGLGVCEMEAPGLRGPLGINLLLRHPAVLMLNKNGQRFLDEGIVDNCFESANALLRQPGAVAYGIVDSDTRADILDSTVNKLAGPLYADQPNDVDAFRSSVERIRPPRGRVCHSLDEVAEFMGVPAEVIGSSVAQYNSHCATGDDPFGKLRRHLRPVVRAPFTVIRGTVGYLNTIGGIRVSQDLEAVDADDVPIGGLFATGVDAGGWQGDTYNFHLAGSSLGFAINSGRIAGKKATRTLSAPTGDC